MYWATATATNSAIRLRRCLRRRKTTDSCRARPPRKKFSKPCRHLKPSKKSNRFPKTPRRLIFQRKLAIRQNFCVQSQGLTVQANLLSNQHYHLSRAQATALRLRDIESCSDSAGETAAVKRRPRPCDRRPYLSAQDSVRKRDWCLTSSKPFRNEPTITHA